MGSIESPSAGARSLAGLFLLFLGACTRGDVPVVVVPLSSPPPEPLVLPEVRETAPLSSASSDVAVPSVPAADVPAVPPRALSPPLRDARFRSPMPGGYIGGWYGDTGLDIAGNHLPVYAIAAGTLDYAERGHTLWMTAPDTPMSVRIALDDPVPWKGHRVTHVYYTHMSRLEFEQAEGALVHRHVEAGELIGTSGIGNHVPHLHVGLLMDGLVEQDTWEGIMREDEIRQLLGGYRNGELLSKPPTSLLGDYGR
jgi:murein DD-endopeptidase MepM/ murein hydrolase activator NlpD